MILASPMPALAKGGGGGGGGGGSSSSRRSSGSEDLGTSVLIYAGAGGYQLVKNTYDAETFKKAKKRKQELMEVLDAIPINTPAASIRLVFWLELRERQW